MVLFYIILICILIISIISLIIAKLLKIEKFNRDKSPRVTERKIRENSPLGNSPPLVNNKNHRMLAVSAYFPLNDDKIKSNSSKKKYLNSFKNTTLFYVDMSIFGPKNIIDKVKQIRTRKIPFKTILNPMIMSQFINMAEKEFGFDNILEILSRNISPRHCSSPELILIWISKILFVKKEIESKPYYSHFGWLDMGYKTYQNNPPPKLLWPCKNLNKIPKGKIVVRRIKDSCHPQYWNKLNKQSKCPIGGCWFGDKKACKIFINEIIKEVKNRLKLNKSLCADQDLMEVVGNRLNIFYDVKFDKKHVKSIYRAIFLD